VSRPTNSEQSKGPAGTEQNVYSGVYRVLLGGMAISTTLYVIAIVRALLNPEYIPLRPEWIKQHYHWSAIVQGIAAFDPTVLMLIATALLILTPVLRVAVSIYAFAVDRDGKFVAVASAVFLVMVVTVLLGLFGLK
jgi:uncharacterized membrane protein